MPKRLVAEAKRIIEKVFRDTSVSQLDTLDNLRGLQEEIETKIARIAADLKRQRAEEDSNG